MIRWFFGGGNFAPLRAVRYNGLWEPDTGSVAVSDWLERNRGHIFFALVTWIGVGVLLLRLRWPQPAPLRIETPTPMPTVTVAPLRVYVCGEVVRADVYQLPPGAIVKDALAMAGGPTADADLTRVNLALPVEDGDQVYVPAKGTEELPVAGSRVGGTTKININKATAKELEALPGIGEAYAQRIVEYRAQNGPFQTVEDLLQVKGIGPSILAQIKDLVTVR